jgi:NADPH-dependent curcumin reductase CurA
MTPPHNLGPSPQGHTAWVGTKICAPKAGETMVVSGAAGAVGSLAAQLGKIAGARVVGIAGGSAKCTYVVGELGLDGCIDYKAESLDEGLARLCPEGVDCFFDNVGGPTLDAVVARMNCFGRIAICGAISQVQKKNKKRERD